MEEKARLVFFDFCETLIKYQTPDKYIDFCREILCYKQMNFLQMIVSVLTKLRFFRIAGFFISSDVVRKKIILYQLKNIDYYTLDRLAKEYYQQCLKPSIIYPIMERLLSHLQSGDEVWIVSGGYDMYIKYFVEEYGLAGYIATNIAFTDSGICMGTFRGLDCMSSNKVILIKKKFGDMLDIVDTIAYSDSKSDLPLLLMVKDGYVISKNKSQIWSVENKLKEILWE